MDTRPKFNGAERLILRTASKADLDDIASVAQAAFPDDPGWNYRFPYRKEYPEDNWKCTRNEHEEYLDQPDKYAVLVVTATVKTDSKVKSKPIAIAVWDISVLTKSTGGDKYSIIYCSVILVPGSTETSFADSGISERKDANSAQTRVFQVTLGKAFSNYFSEYGGKQLHLWLLATHPDFRRRGAGTMSCNWGLEKATVMASPLGKILYEHLGYKLLCSTLIQVDDENEKLTV